MRLAPYCSLHSQRSTAFEVNLPKHWSALETKRRFDVVGGSTPSADPANWDGNITWITPADLSGLSAMTIGTSSRTLTETGLRSCSAALVPAGSIIVSTRAPIGSLAVTSRAASTNQGCKALVPSPGVDSDFVAYVLSVAKALLNARGRGSTFMEISGEELGRFELPWPPVDEQRRIVAFLDHETRRIDELVQEQERLIALLHEHLEALIIQALSGSHVPEARRETSNRWFPSLPASWRIGRLAHHVRSIQTGPFGSQLHASDYVPAGTPLVNPSALGAGGIDVKATSRVDESAVMRLREYRIGEGDLILGRRGVMGRCALATPEHEGWLVGTGSMRIRCSPSLHPRFALHVLRSRAARAYFDLESVGSTMNNLNPEIVGRLPIPTPSIDLQYRISSMLDDAIEEVDSTVDAVSRGVDLLRERRSALITAAVTGTIDVRAWRPTDRPPSKLDGVASS